VSYPLSDPLAHNSWATKQLLAFCRDKLSADQLQATSEGNYGTILGTLQHIIGAEFWMELARSDFDPDRTIDVPKPTQGDPFEVKAGMLVAQTLNHGNEHRAQIFTILTTIGVEPPELDGWSWGYATGRFVLKPAK
jgi:uncharacterized damage-inducible protein DinB